MRGSFLVDLAKKILATLRSMIIRNKTDGRSERDPVERGEIFQQFDRDQDCLDLFSLALCDLRFRFSVPDKFPRCSRPDILHEMRAKSDEALSLRESGRGIQNAVAA